MRRLLPGFAMLGLAVTVAVAGESDRAAMTRDAVWRSIFARPKVPLSTPENSHRVELGRALFADSRLSGDGTRACASCHNPARGFTDGLKTAMGRDGSVLQRNTPGLYNLAWSSLFFTDGRVASLEEQSRVPITTANEMGGDFATIVTRLKSDPPLAETFAVAFPATPEISEQTIVAALSAFERTLVSQGSRFDHWVDGDDAALTAQERDGFGLFVGKAGCAGCHGGWRFTDDGFRDIGLPGDDPGRSAIVGGAPALRQFKTPGLRELEHTAPYMHDGSLKTLRDVVDHYAGGFVKRPSVDSNLVRDLVLTEAEKEALIAFLKTLSSAQ